MAIHITLARPVRLPEADALGRTYFGYDPDKTPEENWLANRADWVLGERALRERYVLFSEHARRKIVMAVEITGLATSPNNPAKKAIEGVLLKEGHPVYDEFVDHDQPESTRVRNPVTYLDTAIGGWPCGCGCGTEIHAGEFVRGHEQTALHQRVAQIGTIPEFIRWFDSIRAGHEPEAGRSLTLSTEGRLELSVRPDGATSLVFTPAP
ncbi:MAG: hypothetical protein L0I24_01235 [Pseudonocardia sp.]|nr:hypothetical protein [Pseudonocardia sp.]